MKVTATLVFYVYLCCCALLGGSLVGFVINSMDTANVTAYLILLLITMLFYVLVVLLLIYYRRLRREQAFNDAHQERGVSSSPSSRREEEFKVYNEQPSTFVFSIYIFCSFWAFHFIGSFFYAIVTVGGGCSTTSATDYLIPLVGSIIFVPLAVILYLYLRRLQRPKDISSNDQHAETRCSPLSCCECITKEYSEKTVTLVFFMYIFCCFWFGNFFVVSILLVVNSTEQATASESDAYLMPLLVSIGFFCLAVLLRFVHWNRTFRSKDIDDKGQVQGGPKFSSAFHREDDVPTIMEDDDSTTLDIEQQSK